MKQILLPLLGTIAFIIAVGFLAKGYFGPNSVITTQNSEKQVTIGTTAIKVEVADTDQKRALGLGKRSSLASDGGMLFVFPQKGVMVNFWMKDMSFPIDIIWIAGGRVLSIDKMVAAEPNTPDAKLKIYSPGKSVDYVLEVNSEFSDKNNIKVGDVVDLSKAL